MNLIKSYSSEWNHHQSNESACSTIGFAFYKDKFYDKKDFAKLTLDYLSQYSKSNHAVAGLHYCPNSIVESAKSIKPSLRS